MLQSILHHQPPAQAGALVQFQPQAEARALHVAVVMDGNGRWAERRGLPRSAGHRAGSLAVRRTVAGALSQGIGTLSLYAFSSDNWRRPAAEVRALMKLLAHFLRTEAAECEREGVRVSVIGRRDRLGSDLLEAIASVEARTSAGSRLHLHVAVDYSARNAILEAARRSVASGWPPLAAHAQGTEADSPGSTPLPDIPSRETFSGHLAQALHARAPIPEVDLLIRTGGEQRLSDFLLWESAYAELLFTATLWPDFGEEDLAGALAEFGRRERRFGSLPPARTLDAPTRWAQRAEEVGFHG
jgi:undecaprenyl diphosphate synthase